MAVVEANGLEALNDGFGHAAGDEFAVLFAGAPILTAERIVRRPAERIAHSTLGIGHRLPTNAWGVADASGEATVDALVEAADRAMYRQKQLMRKRASA